MNGRPADTISRAVERLWAFFLLAILIVVVAFILVTWHDLKASTSRRLEGVAAAAAQVETAYLDHIAHSLQALKPRVANRPAAAQQAALARYHRQDRQDQGLAILTDRDHIRAQAGDFFANRAQRRAHLPPITAGPHLLHRLYLSTPLATARGRVVLFAQPLPHHQTLVREEPLRAWPSLQPLLRYLPAGTHIFVINRQGRLQYRQPYPAQAHYRIRRQAAVFQSLRRHPHKTIARFTGRAGMAQHWRLGVYRTSRYGLIVGVSLPRSAVWSMFAARLEIPLALMALLLLGAGLYYRYAQTAIARTAVHQAHAAQQLRDGQAFAEQQRDFYLALSELNQFIIHRPSPERLFAETCRIIIAYTGLLFVWVGAVESSGSIQVVACAEKRPLGIDWRHSVFTTDASRPDGAGPAGRCVRSGQVEIAQTVACDPTFAPWHAAHAIAGTQSAAAVPVRKRGTVVAVLVLGSEQVGLFTPPLVRLLETLAQDMGFSLEDYEREERLEYQARHDALTGLDNRAQFRGRISEQLARAHDGTRFGIAILDLDGFKAVNDQFGHAIGDELLRAIAERLQSVIPLDAHAARLGGDEFGIVFPTAGTRDTLTDAINEIRWGLDAPFSIKGYDALSIGNSIGACLFPDHGRHIDELIRHADLALYEAKARGKNSFGFFQPALEEQRQLRHRLQHDFIGALEAHALVLYFQPQVAIRSGHIRSVEALLRWPQPDGEVWPAGRFFPAIIQDSVLMRRLDIYVLEQACAALRILQQRGRILPVAVNIHGLHLLHPDFLKDLRAVLRHHPDCAHSLEIEITETSELADLNQAGRVLEECRRLGVAVSLDDFGTGYASLNYLQKLPCDSLKIDRIFISDMGNDARDFAIVSGILTAAHLLGIPTVAEGIEQMEQGLLLRDLGCEYGQGYAISAALPLDALCLWFDSWRPPALWTATPPPGRDDHALWLARAGHRAIWARARETMHTTTAPVDVPAWSVEACPLHAWLLTHGHRHDPALVARHEAVHTAMATCLDDGVGGPGAAATAVAALDTAETALDRGLMARLTRHRTI
ncbi:MAG: bifunctional diguanylate cyclase/phosphodiesterase [Acidiferrobacter sp.]